MLQLSRVRSLASGSSGTSKAAEVRGESGRQRMEARYMFPVGDKEPLKPEWNFRAVDCF